MLTLQKKFIKYLTNMLPIFSSIIFKNEITLIISENKIIPFFFF
jgi:hypothetical protein